MSDSSRFDRQLSGIPALSRMKRPGTTTAPAASVVAVPALEVPALATEPVVEPAPTAQPESAPTTAQRPAERRSTPRTPSRPSAATKTPQRGVQRSSEAEAPKEQIGPRVSRDVTQRARAAYRATGYLEGETSFSDFVETAILREVERREKGSNGGKPFPSGGRLPTGRPLKA